MDAAAMLPILRKMKAHAGQYACGRAEYENVRMELQPLLAAGYVAPLPSHHPLAPGFQMTPAGWAHLDRLDTP
jgi:hypothetical protein